MAQNHLFKNKGAGFGRRICPLTRGWPMVDCCHWNGILGPCNERLSFNMFQFLFKVLALIVTFSNLLNFLFRFHVYWYECKRFLCGSRWWWLNQSTQSLFLEGALCCLCCYLLRGNFYFALHDFLFFLHAKISPLQNTSFFEKCFIDFFLKKGSRFVDDGYFYVY